MNNFLVATGILLLFTISAYGWGRVSVRLFYRTAHQSWAYTIILGLSLLIVIGGILNLLRLAFPTALEILLSLGLASSCVFAALAVRRNATSYSPLRLLHSLRNPSWYRLRLKGDLIPILFILMVTGFFIATLVPAGSFNIHDDFHKYLVAPFQMLQSGSLGGTNFQVVGRDHLGSQSYLQSFVLTRFPVTYINWFDIIFCFFIAGILVNDIGRKADVHPLYRSFAVVAFVFINPQYVNVSALYSASMFILGLIYAALLLADKCAGPDSDPPFLAAVPVGLMTASLISLKATFIPFSLLFGGLIFLAFLVLAGNRKQMAFVGGIAIGTASLVLVPWVLISHNNYGRIFVDALGNGAQRGIEGRGSLGNLEWFSELFFSQGILKYGGTILDYNFTIFTLMAAVLISLYLLFRNRERLNRMYIAVGLCAFVATIAVYLVNGHITRYLDDTVRYTAPVIVAVIPASVLILARGFWRFSNVTAGRFAPALPITTVLVALQIMVAGMFADVFLSRIIIAKNYGMALPYLFKPFIGFNRFALNDDVRPLIRKIQSKTIEGSKILVWVSLPFQFDFKRNQILNIEAAELVVDRIEGERNPEKLRKVLKAIGVRYVLWQSTGMGMERESSLREDSQIPILRKESISKLELRGLLRSLENSSKIILRTAEWTLYDIAKK